MTRQSDKQTRILAFLREYLAEHDYPPSIREIQAACGISSTSVVDYNLKAMETKGLIRPRRTPGNTRLYSEADVARLLLIQRLTTELGLNLAGVERVLALEDEVARLRRRLERLEREAREQVRELHRQYKREIVLYGDGKSRLPEPRRKWISTS